MGFDDIEELQYTDIQLTVVTRPVYEMGKCAIELLERRFQNGWEKEGSREICMRSSVKSWLIKRGSEKRWIEGQR